MTSALRPAAVFSDHMILQREKPVTVWGTGPDGARVTVRVLDAEASAAVQNGRWRVVLPPQDAGGPCAVTVTCGETVIEYSDVLFGDVWLAGGQSNMEWPLADADGGPEEIRQAGNTNIRHYYVPKCSYPGDRLAEAEQNTCWTPCVGEGAKAVSAVAYWFAKEVNARAGVPVGIIGCNWGGTSAAAWMSRERLERMVSGRRYIEEFKERVGNKSDEQYEKEVAEHDRKWRQWKDAGDALRAENPGVTGKEISEKCGDAPWPYPAGRMSPFRPCGLYETMFSRVAPYGLKGFLYYQGEEDGSRHADYFDWMCALIERWREDFQDESLPFLFAQLPMYDTSENIENGWSGPEWPLLREAQRRVSRFVQNAGMAVILDCGELDDIHPTDKKPVGHRLALQALRKVYGQRGVIADGPAYRRCERTGNALRVFFDGAENGLELRGGDMGAFEVAGEDGAFVRASAVSGTGAHGKGTLLVSSPEVPEPCAVRYAWKAYCGVPLYGADGLPAPPFLGSV